MHTQENFINESTTFTSDHTPLFIGIVQHNMTHNYITIHDLHLYNTRPKLNSPRSLGRIASTT